VQLFRTDTPILKTDTAQVATAGQHAKAISVSEKDGPRAALFADLDYLRVVCRSLRTTVTDAAEQITASAVHFGAIRLSWAYASKPFRAMTRLEQHGYKIQIGQPANFKMLTDARALLGMRRQETVVLATGDKDLHSLAIDAGKVGRGVVVIARGDLSVEPLIHAPNVFFIPLENIVRGRGIRQMVEMAERWSSFSVTRNPKTADDFLVFLCHASGDKPAVHALYQRLRDDGFTPWLDEENLLPGQDWEREISSAVRGSSVVLVCLSHASVTKEGFVQKEIKYALDVADEKPEGTILVIPVRLENCDVPQRLRRWHWVNLFEDSEYIRLLSALRSRQQSATGRGSR
jgi:hypothetical protein